MAFGLQAQLRWRFLPLAVATLCFGVAVSAASGSTALSISASNAAGTDNRMFWVCTWGNTNGAMYVSDAFAAGTFTGNQVGPTELLPPFQKFVIAKYGATAHVGSADCIYKFSEPAAQSLLQQRISKPPSGMHIVQTGWKYGLTASGGATPGESTAPASPAASATVPAQSESTPRPPVTTNVTVRLVDAVNSSSDPSGKRYRAVVTQAATAGSVQIPQNTMGSITLAQQSAETFSAQLVSLKLNGKDVAVTSAAVTATSMAQQAQQAAEEDRRVSVELREAKRCC